MGKKNKIIVGQLEKDKYSKFYCCRPRLLSGTTIIAELCTVYNYQVIMRSKKDIFMYFETLYRLYI